MDEGEPLDERVDAEMVGATFVELEYQPSSDDPLQRKSRRELICQVWAYVSSPYEFLKLAHFLEGDTSIEAEELYDAALKTAWRKRTPASDPWDDQWWFEAVDVIPDADRARDLRRFAQRCDP